MNQRPKVGVGVIIYKENKVLLLKRKNTHGEGSWSPPGGHLEFNEELEDCARREVEEETGLKVKNIKFIGITNDMFREEGKHYLTVFMVCDYESGEVENREPEKCTDIDWFEWGNLPENLFLPLQKFIEQRYTFPYGKKDRYFT